MAVRTSRVREDSFGLQGFQLKRQTRWSSVADPYYSSVSLLLPCNGLNNSTTFTDRGPAARTVTAVGAQIRTDVSRFNGSSGFFSGSDQYLTVSNAGGPFYFGSGDYTMEAWVYLTSLATTRAIMGIWSAFYPSDQNFSLYYDAGATKYRLILDPADWQVNVSTSSALANTWTHIACCRNGTKFRMFINGVMESETTQAGWTMSNGGGSMLVGGCTGFNPFMGYLAEVRVTKGVGRYITNFEVPTNPFPTF